MGKITTIQQYYCDDDDIYRLLADTFAPGTYKVANLNDGGRRIEAPRRLTEVRSIFHPTVTWTPPSPQLLLSFDHLAVVNVVQQELRWLRSQKDAREEQRRQQELQNYEDAYGPKNLHSLTERYDMYGLGSLDRGCARMQIGAFLVSRAIGRELYQKSNLQRDSIAMDEKTPNTGNVAWWPKKRMEKRLFLDDVCGVREGFEMNSSRMFGDSEEICIESHLIDSSRYERNIIKNIEGLEDCLFDAGQLDEKLSTIHPRASLLKLRQSGSRSHFSFSSKAGKLILSRLSVTPQFNNILTCFGYEDGPGTNGRSGYCEETKGKKAGHLTFETGYILKHVESKPGSEIPFSIRQMGVYQKFTVSTQKSSSLLIQPSLKVEKRIIELAKDRDIGKICAHWKNLHEIHLGTVSSNWTEYIRLIDAKVCEVEGAVRYAHPNDNSPDRVTFTTLQNLNKYNDILIRITSALELNIFVLSKLNTTAIKRQSLDKPEASEQYEEFREAIQMCITEHDFLKHHVSLIQECSRELASLVQNTITLMDSDVMLTLTKKTIQEAQSMRTITFVAMIYLPASFTATFLSMGFLHVESLNGIMKLHATADMCPPTPPTSQLKLCKKK
ncbi:hypothetical protein HYFRA_00003646 [Hymenoscyphus fraxineus]|uniref:CorA-like transporter domain-containing protein n=1 Tax=Hymenoscyphus fraxineus TaxID=746836 RepID=A0A9N9L094_9HELO|nr:hypothetical protein HYFRA_00003646 [Hymenoscyphus fraxineus]